MFFVKRGNCTYSKKAYNAFNAGAKAVLVYYDDPDTDIEYIIPVADSIYKDVATPVLLVSARTGRIFKDIF